MRCKKTQHQHGVVLHEPHRRLSAARVANNKRIGIHAALLQQKWNPLAFFRAKRVGHVVQDNVAEEAALKQLLLHPTVPVALVHLAGGAAVAGNNNRARLEAGTHRQQLQQPELLPCAAAAKKGGGGAILARRQEWRNSNVTNLTPNLAT